MSIPTPKDLKSMRFVLDRSQPAMATLLKVSEKTYWNWEHGTTRPSVKKCVQLTKLITLAKKTNQAKFDTWMPAERKARLDYPPPYVLKAYRLSNKLTCGNMAEMLKVGFSTYWKWEEGITRPTPKRLKALNRLIGM